MNELVSALISSGQSIPVTVCLLTLTFVFAPGVLLHLGALIFPKGHERRKQFIADLYDVPYLKRPFWVASALVRCLFEGLPARFRLVQPDTLADVVEKFGVEQAIELNSGHITVMKSLRRNRRHRRYLNIPPYRRYWHDRLAAWAIGRKLERLRKDCPK